MKKFLFVAMIFLVSSQLSAQTKKGQWLAGGNVSFASSSFSNSITAYSSTNFSMSPDVGYFFVNNFAGGLKFTYGVNNPKVSKASSAYIAAPFLRYYFLPAGQKVNIFLDGSYGFGSSHSEFNNTSFNQSINQYMFSAGPAIFLSPNTALEFAINYSSTGGEIYGEGNRENTIGFNIGFQIHLGK